MDYAKGKVQIGELFLEFFNIQTYGADEYMNGF